MKALDLYESIDHLPAQKWFQIISGAGFNLLCRNPEDVTEDHAEELVAHFKKLYQEYLDHFGLNEDYEKILRLRRKAAIHKMTAIINSDRHEGMLAKIVEADIAGLVGTAAANSSSFEETVVIISKHMGYMILAHEISVKMYFTHLNIISKSSKQAS